MKAHHPDTCNRCGATIEPGDYIEPSTITRVIDFAHRLRATRTTSWQHVSCGRTSRLDVTHDSAFDNPTAYGPLCPECHTYHRGVCA